MMLDVVAVLDSDFAQVFERARPMKATLKRDSQTMKHPIETGATVTDHRIVLPIEIELPLVLNSDDYVDVYAEIERLFLDGTLLTVQTRSGSYPNMCIASMPHEESPDGMDKLDLALTLHEVQFVTPTFAPLKVKHAPDAKTKDRGEVQGEESKKQSSILSGLFR